MDMNGLYFMTIKLSTRLCQYQGAKGANQLLQDPSWEDEDFQELKGIAEMEWTLKKSGRLLLSALYDKKLRWQIKKYIFGEYKSK